MIEHLNRTLVVTLDRGHPPPIHRPWDDDEEEDDDE